MAPKGQRRLTGNPHANGGLLRKPLELPDFRDYAVKVPKAGAEGSFPDRDAGDLSCRGDAEEHEKLSGIWAG